MPIQIKLLIGAFFIAIVVSCCVVPILRRKKIGQIERQDGPESHLKKQGTPTMGGIIMIISIIIMTTIISILFSQTQKEVIQKLIPLVLVTIGFGAIGFIDDYKKLILKNTEGLKPIFKMLGLLVIAVVYAIYLVYVVKIGTGMYVPIVKQWFTLPIFFYIPFIIFVMLGTTNAVNLTDGVDGLSTSVTTIIVACLTVVGLIYDVTEVVYLGSMICGINLGFLLFNMHPAKIFMGDTGSLLLGGAIASMAIYLKMPLLLIIIALIPIIETVSVMMQVAYFKKTGKRIFKMTPIHHHFELSGWNENKIVVVFSAVTLVLCVLGLIVI